MGIILIAEDGGIKMNITDASSLATVVGVIASILISVASTIYLSAVKFTRVETNLDNLKDQVKELKSDTDGIWECLLRRGAAEAVLGGAAAMNSPIVFNDSSKELFSDLKPDLIKLAQSNPTASDGNLALLIEKKWGDYIMRNICIPNHITQTACLLLAVSVARDSFKL